MTNERISDVSVLSDMTEVRNGFEICDLAIIMLMMSLLK